jgi:hypothetical protein
MISFKSVDFPTFERPNKTTKPDLSIKEGLQGYRLYKKRALVKGSRE